MRIPAAILVASLLAPSVASAQASTADGIRALARGDAASALMILRPLADGPQPDPLAQFFLATLLDTDPVRACGLYLKSATATNPLASQARTLADSIRRLNPRLAASCTAASLGAWRQPPPARFLLGPDHRVTLDPSGFTVEYRGTRRVVPMSWGGVEWVYLPTRYTRLDVTRPAAMSRHFVEFWFWVPDDVRTPACWSLLWTVYEVSGLDARLVNNRGAVLNLVTVKGSRPPDSFAVDGVGRLHVNAEGEAEYVVLGPSARAGVIPYGGSQ